MSLSAPASAKANGAINRAGRRVCGICEEKCWREGEELYTYKGTRGDRRGQRSRQVQVSCCGYTTTIRPQLDSLESQPTNGRLSTVRSACSRPSGGRGHRHVSTLILVTPAIDITKTSNVSTSIHAYTHTNTHTHMHTHAHTFSKYTPANPEVQQAMSTAARPNRGSCPPPASPPESSSSLPELLPDTCTSPTPSASIASAPHCLRTSTLRRVVKCGRGVVFTRVSPTGSGAALRQEEG